MTRLYACISSRQGRAGRGHRAVRHERDGPPRDGWEQQRRHHRRQSTTIFLAEWGDLTQILTANLAVRYHAPLSVGLGRCWPSGRSRPWRCSAVVGSCA